jgi:hypothetical protein
VKITKSTIRKFDGWLNSADNRGLHRCIQIETLENIVMVQLPVKKKEAASIVTTSFL